MDGWTLYNEQQADATFARIPVIATSAEPSMPSSFLKASFFPKPIRCDDVLPVIRQYCGH